MSNFVPLVRRAFKIWLGDPNPKLFKFENTNTTTGPTVRIHVGMAELIRKHVQYVKGENCIKTKRSKLVLSKYCGDTIFWIGQSSSFARLINYLFVWNDCRILIYFKYILKLIKSIIISYLIEKRKLYNYFYNQATHQNQIKKTFNIKLILNLNNSKRWINK